MVKRAGGGHPRVKIWGLLEARLLEADHVVLGGLNETVWPPETRTDAFINRPMRAELGLSPPERRIGQTAHDFSQAVMAAPGDADPRPQGRRGGDHRLALLAAPAGCDAGGGLARRLDRGRKR